MQRVNLGIIGAGTVGGGVFKAIRQNGGLISSRLGVRLRIAQIAVRNVRQPRPVKIPRTLLTNDWTEVVRNPAVDVVVELMGGTTTARQVIRAALRLGKRVVTANKALLSAHGEELFEISRNFGGNLYYEASVAGGIPIIKVLREGLIGNRITRIYGIVNGTCNYILSRMKAEGADFREALAEAQRLGYAEAEPSLDIDGLDAAHKTGILASLAHGFWVNPDDVYVEGIRHLTRLDIQFATQLGYTVKLLGIVKKPEPGADAGGRSGRCTPVQVSVYPTLVPSGHVLASVNDVYNAIYGRGAGQDATASAVLSDVADAALDFKCGAKSRIAPFVPHEHDGTVQPIGEVVTRYYVRLSVIDRPGTLARIAAILGRLNIGISSVFQPEGHEGESVPLILMIHDAPNAIVRKALSGIARLGAVKHPPMLIRVENFD
jgi:homoserine dehydrogenase